jgi:DNA processing protein
MTVDPRLTVLQAANPGARGWLDLVKSRSRVADLVTLSRRDLRDAGLSDAAIQRLRTPDLKLIDSWLDWLEPPDRRLIFLDSPEYPPLLRELADAPLAIWVEGSRLDLLAAPQLAMVGSRNPTQGGRATAEQFAHYLSDRGLTITSGLASGIDGASHRGALSGVAGTVAVLGCGLDVIFPRSHADLSREIRAGGLIVSEYAPAAAPLAAHFPQRNRIIAGLSVGTLVVEAARRSGSLITARLAADYGREVFAIPGSIHSPLSKGCHQLLRDGAKLVEDGADVLVELAPLLQNAGLRPDAPSASTAPQESSSTEQRGYPELLDALGFEPCSLGELARRTGLTTAELSSMLLLLELDGLVEALPGTRYSRLLKRPQ